jgi:hypothetical protein
MFARCGAASWFFASHWQRLWPMPAWGAAPAVAVAEAARELQLELAEAALELQPEQEPAVEALELRPGQEAAEREVAAVEAAEQFIARMAKLN